MSVFDDPASLRGQSFGYALSPLDPVAEDSEEFVEATRLSVFVGEDDVVNISGPVKLYTSDDPIDCDEEPTFSRNNRFIKGISNVISTIPPYGIIQYGNRNTPPPGWVLCNGTPYVLPNGEIYNVPVLLGGGGVSYIIKLPAGAVPRFG